MNASKSPMLPQGKSSLPLPDVVLEPIQLTDPAKKIVYFLKVSCSVVHGGSSAASNTPLQEKIRHTRAKQEGGVDHSSHAILGCWGTTEGRTHLILKHSMPKIEKCFATTYSTHRISKERLPQMATGLF